MKKITLIIFLAASSISFAQEFPLNFTNSNQLFTGVGGATTSLVPDPNASTNQVLRVVGNGQEYDTAQLNLLTNYINLADNANNTITFRVKPEADYGTRTHLLKFESQGSGGGAASTELQFTTSGSAWTNVTLDFPAGLGNYKLMVLFPDFGNTQVGNYLFDDFAGATNIAPPLPPAGPTSAAPTPPARPAGEFISLFSNAYTNIAVSEWSTSWDDSSFLDLFSVPGDDIKKISFGNFLGVQFTNYENATNMTHFHMDYFISAGTDLTGKVLNPKWSNHAAMAGETNALLLTNLPTTAGSWVSVDLPLSSFTPQGSGTAFAREKLYQFLLSSNLGVVYIDNIYLHKNTLLSTDNFAVSKVKLYPNPTSNLLNIESVGTIQNIAIYNVLGQEVMNKLTNETLVSLDVSGLNEGVYVIKTVIDGNVSSTKFIKE
jgi:hypothetical protein